MEYNMESYYESLTVGELSDALEGLDRDMPVVVSANIIAVPLKKDTSVKSIHPDITNAFFINPSIRLGIDSKDF